MKKWKIEKEELKDWIETVVGGLCGVIAIVAAIIEYSLGENGALAGMFKDVFGTAVVVVLLLAAMPKMKPKDLDKKLEQAVENWGENNAPFIFKAQDYIPAQSTNYTQGFRLLQDPKSYISLVNQDLNKNSPDWAKYAKYGKGNHITGKFLDMPSYKAMTESDFEIFLGLEQRHFDNMDDSIMPGIAVAIKRNCKNIVPPAKPGASRTIKLSCSKINSADDITAFVESLDFILSLVKVIA